MQKLHLYEILITCKIVAKYRAYISLYADLLSDLEYGFGLRKPIVPLLVQRGYAAGGWLRAVVGEAPDCLHFSSTALPSGELRKLRHALVHVP